MTLQLELKLNDLLATGAVVPTKSELENSLIE